MKRKIRTTFRHRRHTATIHDGGSLGQPAKTDKGKVHVTDALRQVVANASLRTMWDRRRQYPWSNLTTSDDVLRVQAADRKRARKAMRQALGYARA
jgi:hypothetical protein